MMLPKSVRATINQEIKNRTESDMIQLVRRKGGLGNRPEDPYIGFQIAGVSADQSQGRKSAYDLFPDNLEKEDLLKFWMDFHGAFSYPNFAVFYSKRKFCAYFTQPFSYSAPSWSEDEDRFIALLSDRKFLFLEDNEHGNNPEFPPLSEIVRNPKRYLTPFQLPEKPGPEQMADAKMRENANTVLQHGFVPTYAHKWAYRELKRNEEDIRAALKQRKQFLQRSAQLLKDRTLRLLPFDIPLVKADETPSPLDIELSQLFHDFLYAAIHKAYVSKYGKLIDHAQENSLPIIMGVRHYLDESADTQICAALVMWALFTKLTAKLAKGDLREFKMKEDTAKTERRLTRKTQAPTYRKIECQIMLFDYLLKLLPPMGENEAQEIAYAKFQFHAFSRYNGYTHFRINDISHLAYDPNSGCKFDFSLIPDSKDSVDHLGGVIRHHILRCISNDVRWLTPGLPNNWNTNSSILATLLLQDLSKFPKVHRLTNRIFAFLKDSGKECVQAYLEFQGGQSELVDQLNRWCVDNDLVFDDDISSSDTVISADKMKLLCSRLVLEYMLKERALTEVRQNLANVAQSLWGSLLLTDFESLNVEDDP